MKRNYANILLASALILIAAISRIVNRELGDLYNLAPVGALGLFSGAVIKNKRFAMVMPLLAMFIADLYFELRGLQYVFNGQVMTLKGFYGQEQLWVYGSMILITLMGAKMGNATAVKVLGFSVSGSVLFFLVSNFGVFVGGLYGHSFAGLAMTYIKGLEFFRQTLISDMVFNGLLFGMYYSLQQALKTAPQRA